MKQILAQKREGKRIFETPTWINLEDVFYTSTEISGRKTITILHTVDSEWIYVTNSDLIASGFTQQEGFVVTDRVQVANLNKECLVDQEYRIIHFQEKIEAVVTIAESRFKRILKFMENKKGKARDQFF